MVVTKCLHMNGLNKTIVLGAVILLLISLQSCEENYYWGEVDCEFCYQEKPDFGDLQIDLTINDENPNIPVVIYKGEFDKGIVEVVDTVSDDFFSVDVPINEYYSVTAEYIVNGRKILVVDGDEIRTGKVVGSCDQTCYVIRGGFINARLKYDE